MDSSDNIQTDQQRQKIILALRQIILSVTGTFDLDTLLQGIVDSCTDFCSASRGSLFLYEQESKKLVMRAEKNHTPDLRFNASYDTEVSGNDKIGITTFVFKDGNALALNSRKAIIEHPQHLGKFNSDSCGEIDCQSLICLPLKNVEGIAIGVLKIEHIIDSPQNIFTEKDVQDFQWIVNIASEAIINFEDKERKINISIQKILLSSLESSKAENSTVKLRRVASTFKDISNAVGVSIWLKEGSNLVCKAAVGENYEKIEKFHYDLSILEDKTEPIGLTPWIVKSGKTINLKTNQDIISHPQYKGAYNGILYSDKIERCESFIGAPLKNGNKIIGAIKADSRRATPDHLESHFTTEETHIFSYLSIITSIIIESEYAFERAIDHNRQLVALYKLGTECYELDSYEAIFWYLLVGLTNGEGIGYNRASLFNYTSSGNHSYIAGKMALGPIDEEEGVALQKRFDSGDKLNIDECKQVFFKEDFIEDKLQLYIKNTKVQLSKECGLQEFIDNAISNRHCEVRLIRIDRCCNNVRNLLRKLHTREDDFLAFSLLDAYGQFFIGICENVYSNHCSSNDEYDINAAQTFISQVALALSRLSLKKSKEETTEEAWQEFTAITAHRIGTETSIMSGALNFFKKSLPKDSYSTSWRDDLKVLENSLESLKKAVREYTELQKPPEILYQTVKIGAVLDEVKVDAERLQSNSMNPVKIVHNCCGTDDLPIIYGDHERLLYAFKELYENAIRAMPNGGELEMKASLLKNESLLQVKIIDNGVGIKPEVLAKIFERGFKDRKGGTGLGLYIVKRNIELHGGKIEAINNQTKGACFTVTLPIKTSRIRRIMIAEDTEIHLEYLIRSIKGKYPELLIDMATNEHEAIDLINKNGIDSYDFIIADINLEDGGGSMYGGITILEYVGEKDMKVKVIVITANKGVTYKSPSGGKTGVLEKAKELGAYAAMSRNQERNYLEELNEIINI
jgi:nitrogen-specific signal transduction histidine kinase/transcriptional regulator with GAF, ATPase, and Fis domain